MKTDKPDPIVETVIEKFRSRAASGQLKYGHTLASNPLSTLEWLIHAQEEAMDLANYLQVLINKQLLLDHTQLEASVQTDGAFFSKKGYDGYPSKIEPHGAD